MVFQNQELFPTKRLSDIDFMWINRLLQREALPIVTDYR